ncbi:MAG: molybdopterin molybdotransferase MoeA [Rhodospirillales bacterium]|jgi:molybdopterin molybdotransferase|nr:molybdopterin molybdotransferase MoeA [Rhodospirillales bacterium]
MALDRALALLADQVTPVTGREDVSLRQALGRILAEDVVAPGDVPGHDNAAVDGYAVFFDDLEATGETRLPVTARIAAGHPLGRAARPGEALQVFTGAPLPAGPDTVFLVEDCRTDGDHVILGNAGGSGAIRRGANRRQAGEDIRAGATVLRAGRRLRAQEVGLAASVGRARLRVFEPLRAAVFSTGDEVRDPATGEGLARGCIYDSNRYSVIALLEGLGCEVTDLGILGDRLDIVRDALAEAAREHPLLITTGGVSMGEEDHVRTAVEALGRIHFWRLAIKPGRPLAFGEVGGATFLGLPGNPVAVMVTFMRIARPVIILLSGGCDITPPLYKVRAGFDFRAKKPGRREWLRARLIADAAGPIAEKFAAQGSGILTSMVEADGLVELSEDQGPLVKGTLVDFLPFNEVTR